MKRLFDIFISCLLLVLLSPIIIITACLLVVLQDGPVFFIQRRPGENGKIFSLYKFSTMSQALDKSGELLADADRLTTIGRWLRRLSIDELPQLWNVLKGEMSLVGPRPLLCQYLPLYSKQQNRRHEVKPGITGWAQVNGRNAIAWEEKFKLDVWYVDNQSFVLDMKILIMTAAKLFSFRTVNHQGSVSMPAFKGNNVDESI